MPQHKALVLEDPGSDLLSRGPLCICSWVLSATLDALGIITHPAFGPAGGPAVTAILSWAHSGPGGPRYSTVLHGVAPPGQYDNYQRFVFLLFPQFYLLVSEAAEKLGHF